VTPGKVTDHSTPSYPVSNGAATDTDFMFICSDVTDPAGGMDDYEEK